MIYCLHDVYFSCKNLTVCDGKAVLRNSDLINRSVSDFISGSGSCYFRSVTFKMATKNYFFYVFLLITFEATFS
jgi:hypothetical protein